MTDPYNPHPGQPQYGQPSDPYAQQPVPGQPQYGAPVDPYGQPQQPGYPPAGQFPGGPGFGDPEAPYGRDMYGVPFSDKQKLTAGLLQILLGSFGVGRFYLGYNGLAVAQIAVTWLTCGIGAIWPLIDGIMILTGKVPDSQGRPLRD
ncbi:NINE protein [Nocardia thailandica]|uniref:NINE protein n=1 Tax=Nocardia thailandica TaxID=257275 RepID=A0ABW6PX20_9NOCA|nr:TM2 domain-containing protein [Nocardia thailandica]